jgi:hypothetical protein
MLGWLFGSKDFFANPGVGRISIILHPLWRRGFGRDAFTILFSPNFGETSGWHEFHMHGPEDLEKLIEMESPMEAMAFIRERQNSCN